MMPEIPYEAAYVRAAQLLGQARVEITFLEESLAQAAEDKGFELLPIDTGRLTPVHHCGYRLIPQYETHRQHGVLYRRYACSADCRPVWLLEYEPEATYEQEGPRGEKTVPGSQKATPADAGSDAGGSGSQPPRPATEDINA